VNIDGPFPTLVRKAHVCSGEIVEIIATFGAPPQPTDTIVVTQLGNGEMRYTGYNICPVTPGLPGSPLRYSIFLCPVKAGDCEVFVDIYYTDTKAHRVPFRFAISSN
jgi:hypothetical protein